MALNGNFVFDRFCPSVLTVVMVPTFFCSVSVSFSTIAAIALDRFLAVSVHLRCHELVTERLVRVVLVALWLDCALSTFVFMELPGHKDLVTITIESVGLLVITVAYFCIYKVVRYHQNQIHCKNQIQNGQVLHAARIKKSALSAFYVYINTSLVCFTPNLIAGFLLEVDNSRISTLIGCNASVFLFYLIPL